MLLGFLGLFRADELVTLTWSQFTFVHALKLIIVLPNSKGAQRKGSPEEVVIQDQGLISLLYRLSCVEQPVSSVFKVTYSQIAAFLKSAALFYEIPEERLTTHSMRRGGATWHFAVHGKYDVTCEHGRWADVRTCRTYVDLAAADRAATKQGAKGKERVVTALYSFPAALRAFEKGVVAV